MSKKQTDKPDHMHEDEEIESVDGDLMDLDSEILSEFNEALQKGRQEAILCLVLLGVPPEIAENKVQEAIFHLLMRKEAPEHIPEDELIRIIVKRAQWRFYDELKQSQKTAYLEQDPELAYLHKEAVDELLSTIEDPVHREVIEQVFLQDYSREKVAAQYGRDRNWVDQIVSHTLRHLTAKPDHMHEEKENQVGVDDRDATLQKLVGAAVANLALKPKPRGTMLASKRPELYIRELVYAGLNRGEILKLVLDLLVGEYSSDQLTKFIMLELTANERVRALFKKDVNLDSTRWHSLLDKLLDRDATILEPMQRPEGEPQHTEEPLEQAKRTILEQLQAFPQEERRDVLFSVLEGLKVSRGPEPYVPGILESIRAVIAEIRDNPRLPKTVRDPDDPTKTISIYERALGIFVEYGSAGVPLSVLKTMLDEEGHVDNVLVAASKLIRRLKDELKAYNCTIQTIRNADLPDDYTTLYQITPLMES